MTRHIGICDLCGRLVYPSEVRPVLLLLVAGGCYLCGVPLRKRGRR